MGGTFTSLGALKAAIKKEVEEAMQETMEKSYKDAKDNVGNTMLRQRVTIIGQEH